MSAATGIRIRRDTNRLELTFEDGRITGFPAELLRVLVPSAPGKTTPLLGGKRRVTLLSAKPVGNYALCLSFSDGFDTGIYSWEFLDELSREQNIKWRRYLRLLEDAGLSRD